MQTAVALGNFDGVHKAHAALIQKTVQEAKIRGLCPTAYILEPHPRTLLHPDEAVQLLTALPRKIELLHALGIENVHIERRGRNILALSPTDFVQKILKEEQGAQFVAVGFNYHFGKFASGDAALMQSLCTERNIDCEIVNPITEEGEVVSSTRLRSLLEEGDVESVNRLSFRPYILEGEVTTGKKLGKTLGFPTMNIAIGKEMLVPRRGVYISRTFIDGAAHKSVTNIGINPTVEKAEVRMESHLLDFEGDAYGKNARVELIQFIREETRFSSVDALSAQIQKDRQAAITYFEGKNDHEANRD